MPPLEMPIDTNKEAETQMLLGLSIESRRYCAAQKVIELVIVTSAHPSIARTCMLVMRLLVSLSKQALLQHGLQQHFHLPG